MNREPTPSAPIEIGSLNIPQEDLSAIEDAASDQKEKVARALGRTEESDEIHRMIFDKEAPLEDVIALQKKELLKLLSECYNWFTSCTPPEPKNTNELKDFANHLKLAAIGQPTFGSREEIIRYRKELGDLLRPCLAFIREYELNKVPRDILERAREAS
jgi:hypothetical protein